MFLIFNNELRRASSLSRKTLPQKWHLEQTQKRYVNFLEHVSYTLLKNVGISVPNFGVARDKEEAITIAKEINSSDLVVKAQILAGGRGKGQFKGGLKGGVQMARTPEECGELASKMIGDYLITKQTGDEGRICNEVMITERKFPRKEYYLAVMLERAFDGPVIIVSSQGGVEIEKVAATSPEAIIYEPINIIGGLQTGQAKKIALKLNCENADIISEVLMRMYRLFAEKDALLVEINPFAEDICESNFVLDCKCTFDDNADFRQKNLFALRDWSQEDSKEVEASKYNLSYIALDGDIGCMVNGAGLAMATMDIIKYYNGDPANFLDVGGGGDKEAAKQAFKIIMSDKKCNAILVNIFGGIMRCDIIAEGIVAACKELKLKLPLVCRLQGTNADKGQEIIQKSGLDIVSENDLDKAANMVVKLAKITQLAKDANVKVKISMEKCACL